jgi:hypothetical protein
MSIFEKATRLKVRFNYKGLCTVEDLWDVPFTALDSIYKELNSELKEEDQESLFDNNPVVNDLLNLKLSIVKQIAEVRVGEKNAALVAQEKKAKKQKLLAILAQKQESELMDSSVEELQAMIENL